jgi:lyso-ornithine lipid O-acyltransferase
MTGLLLRSSRIVAYLTVTVAAMPVQLVLIALKHPAVRRFPVAYHRLCCRILGITLRFEGAPSSDRPLLFVANHSSYLDIEILGAAVEGCFVAKAEVAGWPLFGWLAKLQRTVFVERADRAGAARQRDEIRRRLEAGDNLILFPEGTSGDGIHLLPFKTALFSAADGEAVQVQPISVAYQLLDGIPLGRFYRPFFAWYGDMAMAPHLWKFLGMGQLTVVIQFHAPVRPADFGSRKLLAEHCRAAIAEGLAVSLAGRSRETAAAPVPALVAAQ